MNYFEWNLFQVTYVCVVNLKKASTQPFPTLILLTDVVVREKGAARLLKHVSSRSTHHLWTSAYTELLFQKKNMTTTYLIFSPALWISILPSFFSFQPSMRCSLWSSGPRSRHEAGAQKQAWRGELKLQWRKNSDQKTPQSKVFTGVDSTEAGLNTRTQKSPHGSRGELRNAEKTIQKPLRSFSPSWFGWQPSNAGAHVQLPSIQRWSHQRAACPAVPSHQQQPRLLRPLVERMNIKKGPKNPNVQDPHVPFPSALQPLSENFDHHKNGTKRKSRKACEKLVGSLCWYQS